MFSPDTQALVAGARNRAVSDLVRLQARRTPAKLALAFEGRRDTYAELDGLIDQAANALRAAGVSEVPRFSKVRCG